MARSCAHRDQTRQGSNHFIDQIKCRSCGELLFKYNFAKVNDQMLQQCVRSKEYVHRLETTGSAQPRLVHVTGHSSSTDDEVSATTRPTPPPPPSAPGATKIPLPASLSAEVIRKLTDAEVQQVIENERMKIRAEEHSRLAKEILQKGLIDTPTSSISQPEPDTRTRPSKRQDVGQEPSPQDAGQKPSPADIPVPEDFPTPSGMPMAAGDFHLV